jgi:hypothetical protein
VDCPSAFAKRTGTLPSNVTSSPPRARSFIFHLPHSIEYGDAGKTKEIAWKAQHRLHKRYMKLGAAGKDQRKIVTAVARELLGFIWTIGTRAEMVVRQQAA